MLELTWLFPAWILEFFLNSSKVKMSFGFCVLLS